MYLLTIVNQHTQEKQEISFFDKEKAINSFIDTAKDYCYPIYLISQSRTTKLALQWSRSSSQESKRARDILIPT